MQAPLLPQRLPADPTRALEPKITSTPIVTFPVKGAEFGELAAADASCWQTACPLGTTYEQAWA